MRYTTLGLTGIKVSAVGFGCMGMSHAYGAAADKHEMIKLLHQAVELGCTFFDTAEIYGTAAEPHHNEELLGEAFAGLRDRIVLASKCGISFDTTSGTVPYPLIADASPERLRSSLEGSLKRLRTDHLDLYYLHRLDPKIPVEETAELMASFIKEGKILSWGLSEVGADIIERAAAVCPPAAVQNRYSMMARHWESIFPTIKKLGITLVAFSPLANGLLSAAYTKESSFKEPGDYRAAMPQFAKESFDKNAELIELLHTLAEQKGVSAAAVSLAWMINREVSIVPIPGTRRLPRLKENLQAADVTFTQDELAAIDAKLAALPMSAVYGGEAAKSAKD